MLTLQVVWSIWCNIKMGVLNWYCICQYMYFTPIPNFQLRAFFSKSTFHQSVMTSSISWMQCPIGKKMSWKNSHLGNSKKSILNSWSNWSISMCWVTYCQPNKIRCISLITSDWFRFVPFIMTYWMVQTKTSHLGKVSYAIIILGWQYYNDTLYYTFRF